MALCVTDRHSAGEKGMCFILLLLLFLLYIGDRAREIDKCQSVRQFSK